MGKYKSFLHVVPEETLFNRLQLQSDSLSKLWLSGIREIC